MRQMSHLIPDAVGSGDTYESNFDNIRFEPTGKTATIAPPEREWRAPDGGTAWIASELNGAQSQLTRYTQMKNVNSLPDRGGVCVNAKDPNGATTITLKSIDVGPFSDNPFALPTGYEKVQMLSFQE